MKNKTKAIISGASALALAIAGAIMNNGIYTITQSGTPDNPIVYDMQGQELECVLIKADYVIFKNAIVRNCDTFGIRVNGKGVQILDNEVYNTAMSNSDGNKCTGTGGWAAGIRIADASDVVVKGNKVHGNCGEGIGILRAGALVEGNILWDNFSVNIYCDQCSYTEIRNNHTYSTGDTRYYKDGKVARGISIGAEIYTGYTTSRTHDVIIENNIIERVRGINYITEVPGTPYNIFIKNNTFIDVPAPLISLGSWATIVNTTTTSTTITSTPAVTPPTTTPTFTQVTPTRTPTITQSPTPRPEVCFTIVPTIVIDGISRGQMCFK